MISGLPKEEKFGVQSPCAKGEEWVDVEELSNEELKKDVFMAVIGELITNEARSNSSTFEDNLSKVATYTRA